MVELVAGCFFLLHAISVAVNVAKVAKYMILPILVVTENGVQNGTRSSPLSWKYEMESQDS
jgi:hypothetical protein